MRTDFNFTNTSGQADIRKQLEGKSIYEMTVWTRDHAQYLEWFCNYDENKIEAILQPFMGIACYVYENFKDNPQVIEDFRELCIACVLELETNCR